jgi:signal transduction histidine kinase
MRRNDNRQSAWLSWLFVGALAVLSACLGIMQYRWIGEVSRAERERLRASLQASLNRLSQDFNAELVAACSALAPNIATPESSAAIRESEYAAKYLQARDSGRHARMIKSISLAAPAGNAVELRTLNPTTARFENAEWPTAWTPLREWFSEKLFNTDPHRGPNPMGATERFPDLIEAPRFGTGRGPFAREIEWLVIQLDLDYIRGFVIPELLQRDLGAGATGDYQTEIVMAENPSTVIYSSDEAPRERIGKSADATIRLFEPRLDFLMRRPDGRGSGRRGPQPMMASDRGRWLMSARHRAGSLEAVVQKARWRNLAVTTGLLILLMAATSALVRFTRRAQRLAELQMEFVAGVSHELRTPLSVMRTAGHNLRGRVASDPTRVQRYGELIEQESEKLTAIVEQVLRFANANAGRVIGTPEPVGVAELIAEAVKAGRKLIDESGCVLQLKVEPQLPPILADATALQHVLQNLLSNAVKYGSSGKWIGVTASIAKDGSAVEIRVADHGAGIPAAEVAHIFDPFYRGKKPTEDQIHGTGLGLSLARRIVEAHHGTIEVRSDPDKLTEFILRLPAAPVQDEHELANSTGRG